MSAAVESARRAADRAAPAAGRPPGCCSPGWSWAPRCCSRPPTWRSSSSATSARRSRRPSTPARRRSWRRTAGLAAAVTGASILIAVPIAWLTVRTDLPGRRVWATLCTLPLVIPSYVGAYLFVAALGPEGLLADALGVDSIPSIYGFPGAFLVLTLFTYPLVLLPVRAALKRTDPQLEDAARAMGRGPLETFRTVVMPQLWPAIAVGGLLTALFVISDFGAVSIMRFDSFTREIYISYKSSFDRTATAALGHGPRAVDAGPVWGNARLLAAGRSTGSDRARPAARAPTARSLASARARLLLDDRAGRAGASGRGADLLGDQGLGAGGTSFDLAVGLAVNSLMTGVGAAIAGGLAALVVAVLAGAIRAADAGDRADRAHRLRAARDHRRPGARVLRDPRGAGPLPDPGDADLRPHRPLPAAGDRADQRLAAPGLAARRGGRPRARAAPAEVFRDDHRALVRSGILAGVALVFLHAIKELPATLVLAPIGFRTLATEIWNQTSFGFYEASAIPALILLAVAAVPLYLLSERGTVAQ